MAKTNKQLEKLETGISGFDEISIGGLPKGRTTMVVGTAGSGKTMFGIQFLAGGITKYGQGGVMVTFEEPRDDIIRNVRSLGWDLEQMTKDKKFAIVDASPVPGEELVEAGDYDLSALLARIENAIKKVNAKRVVLDSIGALIHQISDSNLVRREFHRIAVGLKKMGVTSIITVERMEEHGALSRLGVEEFVADNVVIIRNILDIEKRRRSIEILKFRGAEHHKGDYPFTIDPEEGIMIIPLSSIALTQRSSSTRISSGNPELDKMMHGGMFRDSIVLVSGATGTGKTLMTTEFLKGAIEAGEKGLLFAFEESHQQLLRNAASWGVDYAKAEKDGLLKVVCRYPETLGLEDHLIYMRREIENFAPGRVAVDSLSALERVSTRKAFREFVIGLTSHIKAKETAGFFTNTTSMLMGSESITETHISTITDSIIMLRYVELFGEIRRGIVVLKMRGSFHDKTIREYVIDETGMRIKGTFRNVSGILGGAPVYDMGGERERVGYMFASGKT